MTVSTSTAKAGPYAGSGTTGPFTVPFRFLENSHLRVIKRSTTGVETDLVLTTDYTVSGAGSASGTVTLTRPLLTGEKLTILRNVPLTQDADYVAGDAFPAETHERALDKLTMITQQLAEQAGRSIKAPITDGALNMTLPAAGERAGRVLAFDKTTGAPEVGPSITEMQSLATAINIADGFLTQVKDVVIARFVAGTHYTQGVTTALTLPNAPLKPNSVLVFFNGVYQESIKYALTQPTLTSTVITFDDPIPAATVEIRYDIGRTFAELDAAVESASASAAALNEYLGTIATANMTFPLDLGQITDPVLYNRFDLGGL